MLRLPLQPMVARAAPVLPSRGPWAFEPKVDGVRAISSTEGGRGRLQSRQQRPLTPYFPEVVAALRERFAGEVVLDGELVWCGPRGLDFMALQRRLTGSPRAAAEGGVSYLVFDALAAGGTDLRGYPYQVRRAVLLQLLDDAELPLAVVPMTTDGDAAAQAWLTGYLEVGVEGVVAKRMDHSYSVRRAWRKVKARTSAKAIAGGVLGSLTAPVALVLGRRDENGRLRVAGRTGPIPRHLRAEVGDALHPPGQGHPWPATLPPARFGDSAPVEYLRVDPTVVVEVTVDAAVDVIRGHPRWRHPATFRRLRQDLSVVDL